MSLAGLNMKQKNANRAGAGDQDLSSDDNRSLADTNGSDKIDPIAEHWLRDLVTIAMAVAARDMDHLEDGDES